MPPNSDQLPVMPPTNQIPTNSPGSAYDFILNPDKPKRRFNIGQSLPGRPLTKIIVGVIGLIVLIIIISIIVSALKPKSQLSYMVPVLQDQQELVHVLNSTGNISDISSNNQTFIATANLALSNSLQGLTTYLTANHYKVSTKQLNLKVSSLTDSALSSAEASGDYNATFTQIMNQQLHTYMNDMSTAYLKNKGVHGRTLLNSDYKQAKLLLVSLNGN